MFRTCWSFFICFHAAGYPSQWCKLFSFAIILNSVCGIWLRGSTKLFHGWGRENRTKTWWFWKTIHHFSKDIKILWLSSLSHSSCLPVTKNKILHRHGLLYWASLYWVSQMLHFYTLKARPSTTWKITACLIAEPNLQYLQGLPVRNTYGFSNAFMYSCANVVLGIKKDPIRNIRQSSWLTSVKYLIYSSIQHQLEVKIKLRVLKVLRKSINEGKNREKNELPLSNGL